MTVPGNAIGQPIPFSQRQPVDLVAKVRHLVPTMINGQMTGIGGKRTGSSEEKHRTGGHAT